MMQRGVPHATSTTHRVETDVIGLPLPGNPCRDVAPRQNAFVVAFSISRQSTPYVIQRECRARSGDPIASSDCQGDRHIALRSIIALQAVCSAADPAPPIIPFSPLPD